MTEYEFMQRQKEAAYERIDKANTRAEIRSALNNFIWHYHESKAPQITYREYVTHFLHANAENLHTRFRFRHADLAELCRLEALTLQRSYPRPKRLRIANGSGLWGSA